MVEQTQTVKTHTFYIVEHFEDELSDWTLSEYVHMVLILSKLYHKVILPAADTPATIPEESLILTNFPFPANLARNTLKEDPLHTKRNTELLL